MLCDQGGSSVGCVIIRGKVKTHREPLASLLICLSQICHEVIQDFPRDPAVRSKHLSAWAVAWAPCTCEDVFLKHVLK